MTRRKCSTCGKDAFAYRIEADGSRTYLCERHLPDREAPNQPAAAKEQKPPPQS